MVLEAGLSAQLAVWSPGARHAPPSRLRPSSRPSPNPTTPDE